ncbi:NUDIX hydrolase [Patescibacteria group bacterium]
MVTPKILASKISYKGKIYTVREESVRLTNGRTIWHEVIEKNDSAAVLVIDKKWRLLINQEYRTGRRDYAYKLPGGLRNIGESPRQAAGRELEEETGLRPVKLTELFVANSGGTSRWDRYYYYTLDYKAGLAKPDFDEDIKLLWVPIKKAIAMAWNNKFIGGEVGYAVLKFARLKHKL